MGISIRIFYEDAERALCNRMRNVTARAHVADVSGLEAVLEKDAVVPVDEARKAVSDWESFSDRNSLDPESEYVYLCSLKRADRAALEPLAREVCSGWADLRKLSEDDRRTVLDRADESVTEWDMLSFDDMNETCARCPLSWDKGRGCIGAFGPDNSLLPSIAAKHGCPLVASVPERAKTEEPLTPEEAGRLVEECKKLRKRLPEEGKMMVRRYSGPLDRMEAAARVCVSEGCRMCFFRSLVPVEAHEGGDHVLHHAHHPLHPGPVLQVLGRVQGADDGQGVGPGHQHPVVQKEVHHLVVDQRPSLVGIDRHGAADLARQP